MVRVEVDQARTILVPTGRDYYRCVQVFEEMLGAEVPAFEPRLLSAKSAGRRYVRVKGKDVPTFVSGGHADLGLTGTDVCEEQIPDDPADSNLRYQAVGEPMCTFELLLPKSRVEELRLRLASEEAEPVVIATSFPNFLRKSIKRLADNGSKLNIVISPVRPSGSVEVLPQLGMCEAVADLVESGETALKNGLARLPIDKVFPAIVWRDSDSMARTPPVGSPYQGIDEAIKTRVAQVADERFTSYTLERLRNPNLAVKDFGEEAAEYLEAIVGGRGRMACTSELADLLFASLVLARAKGASVGLADVLQTLQDRTVHTSLRRKES